MDGANDFGGLLGAILSSTDMYADIVIRSKLRTVLAHDLGHTGVTGDWWWDRVLGRVVAGWIGGLSLGWWCDVSETVDRTDNSEP